MGLVVCSTELEGRSEIATPALNTFKPRLIQLEIRQVIVQSLASNRFKKIIKVPGEVSEFLSYAFYYYYYYLKSKIQSSMLLCQGDKGG